jgi:hypothetical protein
MPGVVGLNTLDLFDIMLIQVKGGSAKPPTQDDIARLKLVQSVYNATHIVLFEWRFGKKTGFNTLGADGKWSLTSAEALFG